jgi:hypothetical protein
MKKMGFWSKEQETPLAKMTAQQLPAGAGLFWGFQYRDIGLRIHYQTNP